MIRIPKAGSSSSCTGWMCSRGFTCCQNTKKESRITKASPRGDLYCPAIRGCIDRNGEYALDDPLTITMIRHPVERALSAFFFVAPHRPRGECRTMQCFHYDFLQPDQYQNPMTKMLSRYYAYSLPKIVVDPETKPISLQQAKARLCSMNYFGITEIPFASALLLYETNPLTK